VKFHADLHNDKQESKLLKRIQAIKQPCRLCDFTASTSLLSKHYNEKHEGQKRFPCDKCEFSHNRKDKLMIHIDSKHCDGQKRYPCVDCEYSTSHKAQLRIHIDSKHLKGKLPEMKRIQGIKHPCRLCDFSAGTSLLLKHYREKHEAQKRFLCDDCEYSNNCKEKIMIRINSKHREGQKLVRIVSIQQIVKHS
jgi:hypothetical protein